MNTFTWPLEFNKPVAVTEEILGHGMLVVQGVHICEGSSKARVFVTVNGEKFVVACLDPTRRVSTKLQLNITCENGEVQFSCSQGAKVVLTGSVEMDSCCDNHEHDHNDAETSDVEVEGEDMSEGEEVSDESEGDLEEVSDEYDEEEEDDEEEDEEEESGSEAIIESSEDEEMSDEESVDAAPVTPPTKKVTFNPKEQGPHKPAPVTPQESPLKPAIKQPESKVGQTLALPGGLKYTILREGRGPVATYGKRVNVKYDGSLASNGKRFDKGVIKFKLGAGEVIAGWDKGVKDMRVGESRRLLIPAHLGYGKQGAPPAIPGNATLVFDVDLINIM